MDGLLAFPVRRPSARARDPRQLRHVRGREATAAEIQELGAALLPRSATPRSRRDALRDRPDSEADVHQVRIEVPAESLPDDDFLIGELAGALIAIAERWATAASPSGTPRSASSNRARGDRPAGRPREREARHRAPHLLRLADDLVERAREPGDVVLGDDERRQALDDVHPVAGDLAEDPVVGEERDDDELGEDPGCIFSSMRQVVRPLSGSPNSIAHIRPSPRTSLTTS
jgi:hypothetical protein